MAYANFSDIFFDNLTFLIEAEQNDLLKKQIALQNIQTFLVAINTTSKYINFESVALHDASVLISWRICWNIELQNQGYQSYHFSALFVIFTPTITIKICLKLCHLVSCLSLESSSPKRVVEFKRKLLYLVAPPEVICIPGYRTFLWHNYSFSVHFLRLIKHCLNFAFLNTCWIKTHLFTNRANQNGVKYSVSKSNFI